MQEETKAYLGHIICTRRWGPEKELNLQFEMMTVIVFKDYWKKYWKNSTQGQFQGEKKEEKNSEGWG